ncbi:hypothetical protein [Salinicola sp. DM10]|uniref:hypothetical protein n=1 Tax=Salinicola sp. DM10 TaxID=2815721 RepID=UPI001A8C2D1F|nr:hypothetical protein [Salinicola sp. DM10]MCE3025712.1 hypothetical protein [Salinicola sp. DM10]
MIRKLAALLLLTPSIALAQDIERFIPAEKALGLIQSAEIYVEDDVDGNCWTNKSEIQKKARLTLESNGIPVFQEPMNGIFPTVARVVIRGVAYKLEGPNACIGSIGVTISDAGARYVGKTVLVGDTFYYRVQKIFSSGSTLNNQFSEYADGAISDIAAGIISARRDPDVIETAKEYKQRLDISSLITLEEAEKRAEKSK